VILDGRYPLVIYFYIIWEMEVMVHL
jgi:hypothetical protein